MRTGILDILQCPRCKRGSLQLRGGNSSISNGWVATGVLCCDRCNSSYDIRDGVPDLLVAAHSRAVQNAFSQQWKLRDEGIIAEDKDTVPWYWTPFTIETLAALLRVFLLPMLLRGRAFYNSLTFLLFDDVAPKYQYRDSKSEVEKRYRQENFGEHFQAREGAYAATKNIAGEARSE